jgi:NADH-quinone oxidoreductase subunit N
MSPLLAQSAPSILDKLPQIWPEIALLLAACVVMVMGLSRSLAVRRQTALIAGLGLAGAGILAWFSPAATGPLPALLPYAKITIAGIGLLLLLLIAGTVDRTEEQQIAAGSIRFNPLRTNRAEFYAFFLFSLTGAMLCASADDLIWLFLALELTSLPTYIMVTISQTGRAGSRSQEAGVKYFFLGALGAAVFLYGFALLYGATGTTMLPEMARVFDESISPIAMLGMLLALIGVGFKIAAVPMHLYTPDVYEGAAAPISAFLAFVPKTAGFLAIVLLTSTIGWRYGAGHSLPEAVRLTLWVMAFLTMTWGNVLAILQTNVKRILAYSSIAHSGYMLAGVIAGPGDGGSITTNGLAAVLFYLLAYGVMNLGAFAVLACLERPGPDGEAREIETIDDLRGLCATHPALGWSMVLCAASLLGLPPLLGFWGKVPLFTAAITAGEIPLVVVLGVNSAIAAFYYLRLVAYPLLEKPDGATAPARSTPFATRTIAAILSAAGVVLLAIIGDAIMKASTDAAALPRDARTAATAPAPSH